MSYCFFESMHLTLNLQQKGWCIIVRICALEETKISTVNMPGPIRHGANVCSRHFLSFRQFIYIMEIKINLSCFSAPESISFQKIKKYILIHLGPCWISQQWHNSYLSSIITWLLLFDGKWKWGTENKKRNPKTIPVVYLKWVAIYSCLVLKRFIVA